jgi:hypothetical protein
MYISMYELVVAYLAGGVCGGFEKTKMLYGRISLSSWIGYRPSNIIRENQFLFYVKHGNN